MGDDRSLDEFFGEADAESASGVESGDVDEDVHEDEGVHENEDIYENEGGDVSTSDAVPPVGTEPDEDGTVTPAIATFRWSPTGVACDSCGETVQRRWRDEESGVFVCLNCKLW